MERYNANMQIIKLLEKYLTENKQQRFTQALYNLGVVESLELGVSFKDNYHEESNTTLEKVQKRGI